MRTRLLNPSTLKSPEYTYYQHIFFFLSGNSSERDKLSLVYWYIQPVNELNRYYYKNIMN